ncbi:MAG: cyclic nucleotide-binding domain-containing protein [Gammaproteobacteria bacterium]
MTMPGAAFSALCKEMTIEEITDGTLFKRGDIEPSLVYLLKGEVILQAEGLVIEEISAKSESARFALAHQIPRKIDAVAKGTVRFLRLQAQAIQNLPPIQYKEDTSIMIVDESEDGADDWMTALLKLPVFQRLPPANLQKILIGLEHVEYDKGATIIEQGGEGDYYYLLKKGQCLVTRKPTASAKEIKLGILDKGETFGEDSLLTGAPRTVKISALTDVSLLRLDKRKFVSLIKEPSIKYIGHEDIEKLVKQGAQLLDIRSQDEYARRHLEGSVNIPSFSLRMQFKSINRDKPVVVICADGRASEAGAFLLLKNKFNALVLKGGMASVLSDPRDESAQFTIDDGVETMVDFHETDEPERVSEPADSGPKSDALSHLEDQIRFLKSENEALRKTNQLLNEKCIKLEIEKSAMEKECSLLSQKLHRPT